jgi:hypothetical protein
VKKLLETFLRTVLPLRILCFPSKALTLCNLIIQGISIALLGGKLPLVSRIIPPPGDVTIYIITLAAHSTQLIVICSRTGAGVIFTA